MQDEARQNEVAHIALAVPRAFRIDFVVEDCVVLELKALEQTGRVQGRRLLTYLKLTGLALGLLSNFGLSNARRHYERSAKTQKNLDLGSRDAAKSAKTISVLLCGHGGFA